MESDIKHQQLGLFDEEIKAQKEIAKLKCLFAHLDDRIKEYNNDITQINNQTKNEYAKIFHIAVATDILTSSLIIGVCLYKNNITNLHILSLATLNFSCATINGFYQDTKNRLYNKNAYYTAHADIKKTQILDDINILKDDENTQLPFQEKYGNYYFDDDGYFVKENKIKGKEIVKKR